MELQHIDGTLIATKHASAPDDAAHLAREAAALEAAAHPGVVELLAWRSGPPASLATRHAGTRTLERTLGLRVEVLADVLATVAETVADLHDRGITHGALDAAHIVLGPTGAPVLCGFAHAALDAPPSARAADVVALGLLIEGTLAAQHHPSSTPTSDLRLRSSQQTGCREALLAVADRIALSGDDQPCTARTIARSLRSLADGAAAHTGGRRRPSTAARATACAALLIIAAAVGVAAIGGDPDGSAGSSPAATLRSATTARPCAATPMTGVDLDGDACTDGLVVEGATVRTSSGRFVLGDGDDEVLVGDWDCDGLPTAALLRRPQGEVYVFDRWSTASTDEQVAASLVDPAVTALRPMGDDSCPILLALDDAGEARGVPLDGPPSTAPSNEDVPS